MRGGALLTDLSSVKTGIADRISSKVPAGIEYVSIHPLFGPGIDHTEGQNIVAIPFKTAPRWRNFSRALRKAGIRVHLMSSANHDRVMGYVQALHHFALLSLGVALGKWDGELTTISIVLTIYMFDGSFEYWVTSVLIQRLQPYMSDVRR